MTPTIRPSRAEDLSEVRGMAERAYRRYVDRIGRKPAPMVADFTAHHDRHELDVLEDGTGTVIGYIVHFRRDGGWFVENVAVDPVRHGTGAGRALMVHAEHSAAAAGVMRIELYTNEMMTENFAFYERLGYRRFDRRLEDGFSRVYLEKMLQGDIPPSFIRFA